MKRTPTSLAGNLLNTLENIQSGEAIVTIQSDPSFCIDTSAMHQHNPFSKKRLKWLPLLLSFVFTCLLGTYTHAVAPNRSEILWDTYGVPHIYGKDNQSLFQAFGWAQAQSHGDLILRLYGQARGRAAEYWGEDYLDSDRWVQTMGIPTRAQAWYEAQNPTFRRYLDAFATGINTYAQAHPELIDDQVEPVLPVTAIDVLAHTQHVLNFTFVVGPDRVASLTEPDTTTKTTVEPTMGSNAWAIAPSRSTSGNAMLLANPHLPWFDRFLWYEAQLTAPDINAYGASLVGVPVLNIAFNDTLGWTHTVNTLDGWDAYTLTESDGGYLLDGEVRAFEIEEKRFTVKQADGSFRQEPLQIRRSIHGPVVGERDGKAIALRVVGLDQPGSLEQWWNMARSTNLAEFEAALQPLQIPLLTVMYADREGHILHLFNGQVPVRSQGDFADWTTLMPGDTSTTLWTETHPYADLPRVLDPPSGWLQNANDPPWTTTLPRVLNPEDYPAYMAPRGPIDFRAQRSAHLLMDDEAISFDELMQYKHSTQMELADRLLDDLIPAARQQGGELARQAADILEAWDHQANADSRGAVLFAAWAEAMSLPDGFTTAWDEAAPFSTPDGLANPAMAVATLEAVAQQMQQQGVALEISWGEVFRLRYGEDVDLPAQGGPGNLGIFRVIDFAPTAEGQFESVGGDTYVAAIEFSDPVRAKVLTSYGNATQANSLHRGEQFDLFARQELRPVWRSRQEIEAHLTLREVL